MAKDSIRTKATLKGMNVGKPDYNGRAKVSATVEFEIPKPEKVRTYSE